MAPFITLQELKESKLGKTLMKMRKHPSITTFMKGRVDSLLQRFAKMIVPSKSATQKAVDTDFVDKIGLEMEDIEMLFEKKRKMSSFRGDVINWSSVL
jgi:hypothetical protein